jgi:ribonuclease P/MRP protein subunit RPP40
MTYTGLAQGASPSGKREPAKSANTKNAGPGPLQYNNSKSTYEMNGKDLEKISEERNLGVIVQQDLKWSKQCSKSVSTANRILGMIKRSFCYLRKDVVLKLYKSLVRPHLEYCVQAWRPYLKKDIELIEVVQIRATKLIKSLKDETYENRFKKASFDKNGNKKIAGRFDRGV